MIKAIETLYKGYRFRSRTEARWAVFFDALELSWDYEKTGYVLEDGTCYLPDFWIRVLPNFDDEGTFIEIKGVEPTQEERKKLELLAKGTGHDVLCFWGEPNIDWNCSAYYFVSENSALSKIEKANFIIGQLAMLGDMNIDSKDGFPVYRGYFIKFGYEFERDVRSNHKDNMQNKIIEAIKKARSARFEFGEMP